MSDRSMREYSRSVHKTARELLLALGGAVEQAISLPQMKKRVWLVTYRCGGQKMTVAIPH